MRVLMAIGLILSIVGSIIVGFNVPKPGDKIMAPNRKRQYTGWIIMILGFCAQLIATIWG